MRINVLLSSAIGIALCITACSPAEEPGLRRVARAFGYEARQLWVDASANWSWLVDAGQIRSFCANAHRAGFNELIFDVKPIVGHVLYPSAVAPELTTWKGVAKPEGLDILGTFLAAAHGEGLRCMVSINTFSEGHAYFERAGPIWDHPEWASVALTWRWEAECGGLRLDCGREDPQTQPAGLGLFTRRGVGQLRQFEPPSRWIAIGAEGGVLREGAGPPPQSGWEYLLAQWGGGALPRDVADVRFRAETVLEPVTGHSQGYTALFVSPLNPEARRRQIELLSEIAKRYPIDGIVLDRMRFEGLENDFGPAMHRAFAARFGEPGQWPESILGPPARPGGAPEEGPRWPEYQQLRSEIIRDFLAELRTQLLAEGVDVPVGVYVGAWYDEYEDVGVNWADDALPTQYSWGYPEYRFGGYANLLDFLCAGAYYTPAEVSDNPGDPLRTVAGSCQRSAEVAGDATFVYGTLYLLQYDTADQLRRAMRAARTHTLGLCVFDASYVLKNDWWVVFEEELAGGAGPPPHAVPSLLPSLRVARQEMPAR